MTLEAKLAAIRDSARKRIPADKLALMHEATDALRASGIMQHVIRPGTPLPPFALSNAHGAVIRSQDVLGRGAVVLTVFRGHW